MLGHELIIVINQLKNHIYLLNHFECPYIFKFKHFNSILYYHNTFVGSMIITLFLEMLIFKKNYLFSMLEVKKITR
jgi:hypothetical protein